MNRQNLSSDPELSLPEQIAPIMTVDQFGHWVANILKRNSSSWLHYNMASLYWRVRGNAPKAMECSRRAVHYAPREYKDIALLSMGTIFHRSKKTSDAIIVLGAAVDHGPNISANHFALANAYAVIDLLLNFEFSYLNTVKKEAHWLKSQASFLKTMKHTEKFDFTNVENNCKKMSELTGLNIKELKKEGDKNSLIQYFLESSMYNENWLNEKGVNAVESAYNLQRLVQHIEKHANLISDYVTKTDQLRTSDGKFNKEITSITDFANLINANDILHGNTKEREQTTTTEKNKLKNDIEESYFEYEDGFVLYPPTLKVSRNVEDFDKDPKWPTKDYCTHKSKTFPSSLDTIYPVFIPYENKGILLKYLLTDKIGLSAHSEHELPWHPPICPQDKDLPSGLGQKKIKSQLPNEGLTAHLKLKFLEYVGDGDIETARNMQDAEIGQRIQTAINMEVAPKWLLYVLSSLYWRVRSNNVNALNCLLTANRTVPKRHKDLVLTSLASVYLEMGFVDEAFAAAEEAFHLSLYEPATNFVLAQLNMVRKNRKTQQFHLKQVIRVEPSFMNGLARTLLEAISCTMSETQKDIADLFDGEVCAQVEPGMSLVCEKDGTNCHLTNIHCFGSRSRPEGSTLIGLLELHNEMTRDENMNEEVLERLRDDKTDKKDQEQHRKNFELMHQYLNNMLKECGPQGCAGIHQIDAPKDAECTYQYLQRGYWMHILSLKQLLTEAQLKLPAEISTVNPSSKKIPECKVTIDPTQDFFMEKLHKVDVEGWEASLSIMHQVAEMFDVFNFGILGSKMAQYVDTRSVIKPPVATLGGVIVM
ncbi:Tetratricopeptide repeat protein 17 [Eumeta japonica]|uniref:Tetratricopeptide repeat protein 17 n=1 Tax=Eumeta variegata TaxID=151549 RepID=A0A4C1W0K0_EUMVA|nr:Tetratricopeptide repeat protein 17 [Eumeta japonica]